MMSASNIPSICYFPQFIINVAYFSMQNSIPITWLYTLTACIRVSNPFFHVWQTVSCPCSWFFLVIYEVSKECNSVASSILQIGIVIMQTPFWILTSAKLFPGFQFHNPVFQGFHDKLYDFVAYLVYFEKSFIQLFAIVSYDVLLSVDGIARFFFFFCLTKDLSVRQWSGRPGLNSWSRHTKHSKNGTCYPLAQHSAL